MRTLNPLWPGFQYLPHQTTGVQWMLSREKVSDDPCRGGVLADEMGLGKTIQMVALFKHGRTVLKEQTLLVAPVAVLEQWKAVIRRAGMNVLVPAGKGSISWEPEGAWANPLAPQIHIVGYEKLTSAPTLATTFRWHRLVYDEAHRLVNMGTGGQIACRIRAERKWMLTATPVVNDFQDAITLLKLTGFRLPANHSMDIMKPIFKQLILARSMDQLRASIPDAPPRPVRKTLTLEFRTEDEAEFYRGMTGIITRRWKALEVEGGAGAALEKLKLFMRLRQLSLHPQIYIDARKKQLKKLYTRPDWVGSSTKFEAIRELIAGQPGRRWIVFCHFRHEMEMLRGLLESEPHIQQVLLYNGDLNATEKQRVIEQSHEPVEAGKSAVICVQLQSGGTGLNLQHYNRILFTGPWWTKALMEQAVGRAVRIGQREVVEVWHLQLEEETALNIDTYMHDKAESKGQLCREVLGAAQSAVLPADLNRAVAAEAMAAAAADAPIIIRHPARMAPGAPVVDLTADSEDEGDDNPTNN